MDESGRVADELLEEDRPLSETVLCVRYTGNSDYRILNRASLSGGLDHPGHADELIWTPGFEVPWSLWLEYAGSEERAREVFSKNAHEFELVGPGAEDIEDLGVEEFSIGESVG